MNILVVLRNLYNNPDPFDEESLLCDSDINVLTEACDLRDTLLEGTNSCVTALLVSESQADYETVLKKAASYGADRVVHAALDGFDFSDTNAFARVIAGLIQSISPMPDVVMFGRLAYDGDSVNIATQTAENLDWHRAVYSTEVLGISGAPGFNATPKVADETAGCVDATALLTYKKALDDGGLATIETPLPTVVHTIRRGGLRRQAKIADIIRAYNETEVTSVTKAKIEEAAERALSGPRLPKPTQELPPYRNKGHLEVLNGTSDVDTASNIIATLKSLGFEPQVKK